MFFKVEDRVQRDEGNMLPLLTSFSCRQRGEEGEARVLRDEH